MTVPELFVRGGPVVWVLAVWSVLGLAIVLERWLHFLRMGRSPSDVEHLLSGEKVSKSLRGPEGELLVNGREVDPDGLEELLRGLLHAPGNKIVRLRGDRAAHLERAVQVMDAARRAGAASLDIVTEKP